MLQSPFLLVFTDRLLLYLINLVLKNFKRVAVNVLIVTRDIDIRFCEVNDHFEYWALSRDSFNAHLLGQIVDFDLLIRWCTECSRWVVFAESDGCHFLLVLIELSVASSVVQNVCEKPNFHFAVFATSNYEIRVVLRDVQIIDFHVMSWLNLS